MEEEGSFQSFLHVGVGGRKDSFVMRKWKIPLSSSTKNVGLKKIVLLEKKQ